MAFKIRRQLWRQIMRFIIIGTSAALVNLAVVYSLVEARILTPLMANILAFICAFQISYFGHRFYTFEHNINPHYVSWPRLLLLSSGNFIANEGLFYFFLQEFRMPYLGALFLTLLILPGLSFLINKLWVFHEPKLDD